MKLGTETGSFYNHLYSTNKRGPVVGEGATELFWTDRHAYFVDSVSADGRECVVERAKAVPLHTGMTDSQAYDYQRDPQARPTTLRFRYGRWRKALVDADGKVSWSRVDFSFGFMKEYYDFSF